MVNNCLYFAFATVADSRDDYYQQRAGLLQEELESTAFVDKLGAVIRSEVIRTPQAADDFGRQAAQSGAQAMIIHIPIWADPELSLSLAQSFGGPVLLLGNTRGTTSSVVGTLGAGGGLDQCGISHSRVFGSGEAQQETVLQFLRAAYAKKALAGSTMLRFGERSLGIVTADPVEALWRQDFSVSVRQLPQEQIVELAEAIPEAEVERQLQWLLTDGSADFDEVFTEAAFRRQIRSYLATKQLIDRFGGSFLGVKCQKELSDGYVTQCQAHALLNGTVCSEGRCDAVPYACEADANGAITMRILNLLSGGKPATLLDIRTLDPQAGVLTLANCGGTPLELLTDDTSAPLRGLHMCRHTFGAGGGGGLCGTLRPGKATLARLSVKNGRHCMSIVAGEVIPMPEQVRASVPHAFPCAQVRTGLTKDFLQSYDSNHIHLVYGDYIQALQLFCGMTGIDCRLYS